MSNIAIFASGSGTNAENIMAYFRGNPSINISLIVSNNKDAYVLQRAHNAGVFSYVITRDEFYCYKTFLDVLNEYNIDRIVLAGFLWLIPEYLIEAYPQRIINIHPALLPKYGGKGMHGMNVHNAVFENKEVETGITIHLVNKEYDKGLILFQAKCSIDPTDSPEIIANKVHKLEYEHYPVVIENWIIKSIFN